MRNRTNKAITAIGIIWVVMFIAQAALVCAVIYAAGHFIAKFW